MRSKISIFSRFHYIYMYLYKHIYLQNNIMTQRISLLFVSNSLHQYLINTLFHSHPLVAAIQSIHLETLVCIQHWSKSPVNINLDLF